MIKKTALSFVSLLMVSASFSAQSAAQFGFEFSASSPSDQLAWVKMDSSVQVASTKKTSKQQAVVAKRDTKGWDPLGVLTMPNKGKSVTIAAKKSPSELIKTVSATSIADSKKNQAATIENIWDFIH